MLSSILALKRTPPVSVTVSLRRTHLATDDVMPVPMYGSIELIKRATVLRAETSKNLRLVPMPHKRDYNRRFRFTPTFLVGDHDFPDRSPLFRFAAEQSVSERNNNLLLRKQGPYKVIAVNKITL